MNNEEDDWTFLYESDGINKYLDELWSFNVLYFTNQDPEPRVLKMANPLQLKYLLDERFPIGERTTINLANHRRDILCPYFHIVLHQVGSCKEVDYNYKLQTFLRRAGISNIPLRCRAALIVGLMQKDMVDSAVDVPIEYHMTSPVPVDMVGPIDITSAMSSVHSSDMDKLCGVEGMLVPFTFPQDCHWCVLKYLRHPCAEMILDHRRKMLAWIAHWDAHFDDLVSRVFQW